MKPMTGDQATRLLSVVDRLARSMPLNAMVIELREVVHEILRDRPQVAEAVAPTKRVTAPRAKPSSRKNKATHTR
jgi:hypothetical protein